MGVIICAAITALNVVLYVSLGYWWNLAAAVFCGLMTIATAVIDS